MSDYTAEQMRELAAVAAERLKGGDSADYTVHFFEQVVEALNDGATALDAIERIAKENAELTKAVQGNALAAASAAKAGAETVATLTAERDTYRTLAGIGTWHSECRPNRAQAARELEKSQAVINKLADTIATLTAEVESLKMDTEGLRLSEASAFERAEAAEAALTTERQQVQALREWLGVFANYSMTGRQVVGPPRIRKDVAREILAQMDTLGLTGDPH